MDGVERELAARPLHDGEVNLLLDVLDESLAKIRKDIKRAQNKDRARITKTLWGAKAEMEALRKRLVIHLYGTDEED